MKPSTVTRLRRPALFELNTDRWIEAIGALKQAGFRVNSTPHTNRFSIVDDIPVLTNPVARPKR